MMTSELLANGVGRLGTILDDMYAWLDEHDFASIPQMRGSMSRRSVAEPAAFERANFMKVLDSSHALP